MKQTRKLSIIGILAGSWNHDLRLSHTINLSKKFKLPHIKHNHSIDDNHEPAIPSSCFHSGVKQNQTKILKFGVIYHGGQIFKEIQSSCIQCELKRNKPFKVKMGHVIFNKTQFFFFYKRGHQIILVKISNALKWLKKDMTNSLKGI